MRKFGHLLHNATHRVMGSTATLQIGVTTHLGVRVYDRTAGVQASTADDGRYPGATSTVLPAAAIMYAELARIGVVRGQLRNAILTLNGAAWRIESTQPKPTINGEADGELLLFLTEN